MLSWQLSGLINFLPKLSFNEQGRVSYCTRMSAYTYRITIMRPARSDAIARFRKSLYLKSMRCYLTMQ
jgi:hypothetical protein